MWVQLPYLVRVRPSGNGSAGPAGPPRDLVGKAALMKMWDDVKNEDLAKLEWNRLQPFVVFGFLLDAELREDIMAKLDVVIRGKARDRKRTAAAATTTAASKKSKTKGDGEEEAVKLVAAM